MTTFLRRRARVAGALLAAMVTSATVISTAGTAAAEEVPQQALITQDSPSDYQTRIVGGTEVPEGEYPFIGFVEIATPEGTFACGGSLYAEDLVLTAAHCVNGTGPDTNITVYFGSNDINSPDMTGYQSEYVYSANISGIPNDWALVKLTEPVEGIDPLPVVTDDAYDNGDLTVAGWGATSEGGSASDVMLEVTVPFVSDEDCAAAYGDSFTPDAELCAGDLEDGGIDACQGDSGGPIFREDDGGELVQVGIVSWGEGCAQAGYPGIYTQLSTFTDSIAAVATGENTPAVPQAIEVETTIDTPVEIALVADDAEGDELSFKVSDAETGTLTTEDPETLATVIYTPAEGFEGEDTFQFLANDGHTDSEIGVVTITVAGEAEPTEEPTPTPTPTDEPTDEPTEEPTPTETPSEEPTEDPGDENGDEELPDTGSSTTTSYNFV